MIVIINLTNIVIAFATVLGLRGKKKPSWGLLGYLMLLLLIEQWQVIGLTAAILLQLGGLLLFFYFDNAEKGDDLLRRVTPAFYFFLVTALAEKASGFVIRELLPVTADPYLLLGASGLSQLLVAVPLAWLVSRYLLWNAKLSSYLLLIVGFLGFAYRFFSRGWIEWGTGTSITLMRHVIRSASIGFMVILLAVLILSQLAYQKQLQLQQRQQEYEAKRQELLQQVALFQQNRRFKHNIQNSLIPVQQFLQEALEKGGADRQSLEQITAYYQQSLAGELTPEDSGSSALIQLGQLPDPAIRNLLQMKLQGLDPEKYQVTLQIQGLLSLTDQAIPSMVEVLGMILDNAVEALTSQGSGELIIEVYQEGSDTLLLIMNTVAADLPDLASLLVDGSSTKGSGRGFGLGLIQQLLIKLGFQHSVEVADGYFSHTIRIAGENG